MNSDSQNPSQNNQSSGSNEPADSSGANKQSSDKSDIFSLDSIDDSWLDEPEDFSRSKEMPETSNRQVQPDESKPAPPVANQPGEAWQNPSAPASMQSQQPAVSSPPQPAPPPPQQPIRQAPPPPQPQPQAAPQQQPQVQLPVQKAPPPAPPASPALPPQQPPVQQPVIQQPTQQVAPPPAPQQQPVAPGVPYAGVAPGSQEYHDTAIGDTQMQLPKNELVTKREGFHHWVEGSDRMLMHGEYRELGSILVKERSADLEENTIDTGKPELTPGQKEALAAESQTEKVENLLSGNYSSVSSGVFNAPGQGREVKKTMSELIGQDLKDSQLIGEQFTVAQEVSETKPLPKPETSVEEFYSKRSGPQTSEIEENVSPPQGPPTIPQLDQKRPSPKPVNKSLLTPPPDMPSEDAKPVISKKDFSKYQDKSALSIKVIIPVIVVVGIVFGACLYQFKDIFSKNPDTKTEQPAETQTTNASSSSDQDGQPGKSGSSSVENWERDFEKGSRYYANQDFDKAIIYFSTSIAENKNQPKVLYSRGLAYSKTKQYDEAIADFTQALELDPDNEDILLDRAGAYVYAENLDRAERDYARILKVNPNNSKASYGQALIYVKEKNYNAALRGFEKTIEIDPYYVNAYYQIGMINAGRDKNETAIEYFGKALKLDSKRADIYYERALAHYAENNLDGAISDLTEAVSLKPRNKDYLNDRGFIYLKMNKPTNAKKDFESALKIDPYYELAKQNLEKAEQAESQ